MELSPEMREVTGESRRGDREKMVGWGGRGGQKRQKQAGTGPGSKGVSISVRQAQAAGTNQRRTQNDVLRMHSDSGYTHTLTPWNVRDCEHMTAGGNVTRPLPSLCPPLPEKTWGQVREPKLGGGRPWFARVPDPAWSLASL